MQMTEMMANTLAALEESGSSTSSQIRFRMSLEGKGFTSSIMKPSLSL